MGCGDRGRHLLSRRTVHRGELQQLRADRDELDDQPSRTRRSSRTTPTATACVPRTPPVTSARTPTSRRRSRRSPCRRTTPCSRSRERSSTRLRDPEAAASRGSSTASRAVAPATGTITSGGLYTPPSARRDAHDLRHHRGRDCECHRLRLELRGHVHVPQRQPARRREPERDGAHAGERQLDELREALQLHARRPDVRVAAVCPEREHSRPGLPQHRARRDRARQRLRVRRRREKQHADLEGLVHQSGSGRDADPAGRHRRDRRHSERDRDHRNAGHRSVDQHGLRRRGDAGSARRHDVLRQPAARARSHNRRREARRAGRDPGNRPRQRRRQRQRNDLVQQRHREPAAGPDPAERRGVRRLLEPRQQPALPRVGDGVQRVDAPSGLGLLHDAERGEGRHLDGRRTGSAPTPPGTSTSRPATARSTGRARAAATTTSATACSS